MELKDLFIGFKQVKPVQFYNEDIDLPKPIYLNFDRVKNINLNDQNSNEWSTKYNNDVNPNNNNYNWEVDYMNTNNYNDNSNNNSNNNSIITDTNIIKSTDNTDNTDISGNNVINTVNSMININQKLNKNYNDWIQKMIQSYKKLGLSDNAIKNLIAQISLESNYGQSNLSKYNNFGGITAGSTWSGKTLQARDKDKNGNPIIQNFRIYNDIDQFTKDHINLLTRLYDFNQDDDLNTFLNKLGGNNKRGYKYAQAPNYKTSVTSRYKQIFG